MMSEMIKRRWLLLIGLAVTGGVSAIACQVPVFRYALERWPPDKYEIVVMHDQPLSEDARDRLTRLRELGHTSPVAGNFSVRTVQIEPGNKDAPASDSKWLALWRQESSAGQPMMAVLYPQNAQSVPNRIAHTGPFTDEAVQRLGQSPLRTTIIERLLDGESAVWIFVPSGNSEADAAAFQRLQEHVQSNENDLELPEQEEVGTEEELLAEVDIELRLDFSIVTLRRDDPAEQMLLQLLMASEPDLQALDQPMAFPVLGRGRVLYGLVGDGIAAETIGIASRFIIGPCSCQVKEQNPGFDLLLSVDWDREVGTDKLSDPLPEERSAPVLLKIPPGRNKK